MSAPPAERTFVITSDDAGMRLDQFLTGQMPEFSRSRIQALIRAGEVLQNNAKTRPSETIREHDTILWHEPAVVACETASAEKIALDILFEDEALIVLNKPAGMVVHPGAGNKDGTMVSALLYHCTNLSGIGGVERPGIVHRLDKETSGCLVVAKTDAAHRDLAAQFAEREVKKTYLALVAGAPLEPKGFIDAPIERHKVHRQKMMVSTNGRGRDSFTEYRVVKTGGGRSLIECHPRTGRTHQIRVHLKHIGFPVLGDPLYGRREDFDRHMLHAWKIEFRHPTSGETVIFEAPPPPEFRIS